MHGGEKNWQWLGEKAGTHEGVPMADSGDGPLEYPRALGIDLKQQAIRFGYSDVDGWSYMGTRKINDGKAVLPILEETPENPAPGEIWVNANTRSLMIVLPTDRPSIMPRRPATTSATAASLLTSVTMGVTSSPSATATMPVRW